MSNLTNFTASAVLRASRTFSFLEGLVAPCLAHSAAGLQTLKGSCCIGVVTDI